MFGSSSFQLLLSIIASKHTLRITTENTIISQNPDYSVQSDRTLIQTCMHEKSVCYMVDLPSVVCVYSLLLIENIILFHFGDQLLLLLYLTFAFAACMCTSVRLPSPCGMRHR